MCWDGNTEWRWLGSAPSRDATPPVVTWRDVRPSHTKPYMDAAHADAFLWSLRWRQPSTHSNVVAVLPVSVSYNATFAVNQVNVRGGIESPQTAATSQNISLITAFRAGESSVSWGYCRFENCQTSKKKKQPNNKGDLCSVAVDRRVPPCEP